MTLLGTQTGSSAPVQDSFGRFAAASFGMTALGTQRPRSLQHLANSTGAWVGPGSHPTLQIPVAVPSLGLKHGTQRSVVVQVLWGRIVASVRTTGMHDDAQRPSAPETDEHFAS